MPPTTAPCTGISPARTSPLHGDAAVTLPGRTHRGRRSRGGILGGPDHLTRLSGLALQKIGHLLSARWSIHRRLQCPYAGLNLSVDLLQPLLAVACGRLAAKIAWANVSSDEPRLRLTCASTAWAACASSAPAPDQPIGMVCQGGECS